MTLRASLLRQIENPSLSYNHRAELRCELAKSLEDAGEYEEARQAMGELWRRVGERPDIKGLDRSTAAEVLLRAGVLSGLIGHANQIEGAQEAAKNLISESVTLFEEIAYAKKVLEAQTELSLCYWREGRYDEARIILKDTLAQLITDSELKAKAVLRSAIVERGATRHNDALRILTESATLFDRVTNHAVKGGYHNELAIVLRNLGASEGREDYTDRAFVEYAAASFHFEQAGHRSYRANVENNLGFLHFKAGRFAEAHEHLDRARLLLVSIKDGGTIAQVDETRARVFLAEGRNAEAERVVRSAVATLEKGGRQSLLAEALTTHGAALARLGRHDQARHVFTRSIDTASLSGALNDAGLAALTLIEETGEHLRADDMRAAFEKARGWLSESQDPDTLRRLLAAAGRVLGRGRVRRPGGARPSAAEVKEGDLRELMHAYEGDLIRQALEKAQGSVTRAARSLGVSYQSLTYLLKHRHPDLLTARSPAKRRRRSIIKKGAKKLR